ncbi:DNA polymerase alpha subunit B-like [Patagioenas fasciata monilis]|uniref:DNA polymerase alpha subunit B n=1 Tax=Patagioenas fasciata monilis TaxID=372326 RepID=A0A1V4J2N1_PATFA|nr:DNA polymerase alpha subunit B-like [Patagioenas fasciata monilis]
MCGSLTTCPQVLSRRSSRVPRRGDRPHRGLHDIQSLQDLLEEEEEDELLDAYTTPSKGARKRSNSSPEQPRHKRLLGRSPLGAFSPGSFSPSVTPSRHYASRGGRGDVVATFGDAPGTLWSSLGTPSCTPRLFGPPERHLSKPYKFMFQKPLDVREVMLWRMEELGDALKRHHQLEDFAPVTLPAQEPVTVLGQIACDSAGKLNAHSVLLVGDAAHAGGAQIPLDLSELTEFSLFPGQIVALEGTNSTGRRMRVTRIYEGVPLPFHAPTEPLPDQVSVLVACGPFTPSDGVAFEPLRDLLDVIERDRPDLCLLLGPFLDARHEQVQRCELPGSFGEVFRLCLRCILDSTRSCVP